MKPFQPVRIQRTLSDRGANEFRYVIMQLDYRFFEPYYLRLNVFNRLLQFHQEARKKVMVVLFSIHSLICFLG
jgi:hypothetical protein